MITLGISSFVLVCGMCMYRLFKGSKAKGKRPVCLLIIMGSGGHTSEMVKLISNLDLRTKYKPVHFLVSEDDTLSRNKIAQYTTESGGYVHITRRSRKVGQSYLTSVITTLVASYDALMLCLRIRPEVIICNGPGTCIPMCLISKMVLRTIVIFVESFCRVESLSLSGKILYFVADHFVVQWPLLKTRYPRSIYLGPGIV